MVTKTQIVHAKIVTYVQAHPEMTLTEIAQRLTISTGNLAMILHKAGVRRTQSIVDAINMDELDSVK